MGGVVYEAPNGETLAAHFEVVEKAADRLSFHGA
jgi:hypothetical protein